MRKIDLEVLTNVRIEEACALLDIGHFSGAYYLAGYAIECALKVVIAKNFRSDEIPDKQHVNNVYVHNLAELTKLAGLHLSLKTRRRADQQFDANWEFVAAWREQTRYMIVDEDKARNLIDAIRNSECGILPWIKNHW